MANSRLRSLQFRSSVFSFHNLYCVEGHPSMEVIFHQMSSSINDSLPSKVTSIKICLPSKIVFNQRLSSIKYPLPSKVFFYKRASSLKDCLPSKIVFHQSMIIFHPKSSSIKGCLPSNGVFPQRLYFIKVGL